ncbi:MAG: hypothetical protein K2Y39_09845 [Candidatus Obscuribacterales bacterium]|nr:hypothetical protein [Candidatus Obscuribacterales bacterium]
MFKRRHIRKFETLPLIAVSAVALSLFLAHNTMPMDNRGALANAPLQQNSPPPQGPEDKEEKPSDDPKGNNPETPPSAPDDKPPPDTPPQPDGKKPAPEPGVPSIPE